MNMASSQCSLLGSPVLMLSRERVRTSTRRREHRAGSDLRGPLRLKKLISFSYTNSMLVFITHKTHLFARKECRAGSYSYIFCFGGKMTDVAKFVYLCLGYHFFMTSPPSPVPIDIDQARLQNLLAEERAKNAALEKTVSFLKLANGSSNNTVNGKWEHIAFLVLALTLTIRRYSHGTVPDRVSGTRVLSSCAWQGVHGDHWRWHFLQQTAPEGSHRASKQAQKRGTAEVEAGRKLDDHPPG